MKVLYFHSDEQLLPLETAVDTVAGLLASSAETLILGDLCRLAVDPDDKLANVANARGWTILSLR